MSERQAIGKEVKGNRRKQMMGKTLWYEHCYQATRDGIDKSRAKEWRKCMDFGASFKHKGQIEGSGPGRS